MKENCFSEDRFKKSLDELAEELKKQYSINIWFVEILGKRLSYIAGKREYKVSPTVSIKINKRFAFVSENWEYLSESDKGEVLKIINTVFNNYEQE